jgi:hypothetical protein
MLIRYVDKDKICVNDKYSHRADIHTIHTLSKGVAETSHICLRGKMLINYTKMTALIMQTWKVVSLSLADRSLSQMLALLIL